jgi:hypothetical protein
MGACIFPQIILRLKSTHRVKSNALFSYQPPFNILAFLILKPTSWFFTPRFFHTTNVFLIKITSLPQLILISLYERRLASSKKPRISKDTTQSFFNSLSMARHIKNMPLMEALTGSPTNDLFEAIFNVELDETDYGLFFDESDGQSFQSREHFRIGNGGSRSSPVSPVSRVQTRNPSLGRATEERSGDPGSSNIVFPADQSSPSSVNQSPLNKLFRFRFSSTLQPKVSSDSEAAAAAAQLATRAAMNTEASAHHIETLLETVRELPVHKLREEMKELQVCYLVKFVLAAWISYFRYRIVRHASRVFC